MQKNPSWEKSETKSVINNLSGEKMNLITPIYTHKQRKTQIIFLNDLIKAEQHYITRKHGLNPTQLHELLLIYTDSRFFEGKRIIEKTYRFNKMLFYIMKLFEKTEYAKAYEYNEFGAARAGPVPKHLKNSINDLQEKRLVNVKWSHRPGISSRFELTNKGEEIAKSLWTNMPDKLKLIYKQVKQDLSLISAKALKDKVHREYPEYKKNYTELDEQE
jgi:hypothetical protein